MEWFLYGRLSTADLRLLAVLASPQRPTFCERRDVAGPRRAQAAEKGMGALEHPWAPRMANAPFAAHECYRGLLQCAQGATAIGRWLSQPRGSRQDGRTTHSGR